MDVWALRSRIYDRLEASDRRRWAAKRNLFQRIRGRTLLVAAGTGIDFQHLPAGDVVAFDLSPAMLARARRRVHDGRPASGCCEPTPFDYHSPTSRSTPF